MNFSLCGIPYWNSDIGGFFLWNFKNPLKNADYRELYARWIQFGTFCPMMRSHGTDAPREIYQFGKKGDKIYDAIEKYINLRYMLSALYLFLIMGCYSQSFEHDAGTGDGFCRRQQVLDMNDEYMFGKSILVCPVTHPMYSKKVVGGNDTVSIEDFSMVKEQDVYLPKGADWFDFWTGEEHAGGQKVMKEVPIDMIPLYVKAGSIIPIGPQVQYATEKKWDNLEIRIYAGADGSFTLYEDENDNYNYEKGLYSTITFNWNDKKKTLTIGDRQGRFPGMQVDRKFNILLVSKNKGTVVDEIVHYDKSVAYNGNKIVAKF